MPLIVVKRIFAGGQRSSWEDAALASPGMAAITLMCEAGLF